MTCKSNRLLYITLGSVLAIIAGLIIVMWRIGLFDFTGTDPSSKVVGAALALVGTLVVGAITIAGTVLKQSFDQQAEQRLKLEAAVRTLQLFSTNSGCLTPDIQRDGALFALANLGQYELTLHLVDNLLDKGILSAGTTSSLLNYALSQGDQVSKEQAINIILDHANCMITTNGVDLPTCLFDWEPGFPVYVREWAPIAFIEILLSRSVLEWSEKSLRDHANALIAALCIAWDEEKMPRLKNDIGVLLDALFRVFPEKSKIFHTRMTINIPEIKEKIKGLKPQGRSYEDVIERIDQWASIADKKEIKNEAV